MPLNCTPKTVHHKMTNFMYVNNIMYIHAVYHNEKQKEAQFLPETLIRSPFHKVDISEAAEAEQEMEAQAMPTLPSTSLLPSGAWAPQRFRTITGQGHGSILKFIHTNPTVLMDRKVNITPGSISTRSLGKRKNAITNWP